MTKGIISLINLLGMNQLSDRKKSLSRNILLKLFNKISVGILTIEDDSGKITLGKDEQRKDLNAEVIIHDRSVYENILSGGILASGEAYIDGSWSSPNLPMVIQLFSANLNMLEKMRYQQNLAGRLRLSIEHFFNRNTVEGSQRNIAAHYDLGNNFFKLFLDNRMMYSSAVFFDGASSLDKASQDKLDNICQLLELTEEDHLLEIGTGWGGMAIYAAQQFNCQVTTTTISKEQYKYALEKVKKYGLEEKINVLLEDYRNLSGQFNKLVSIEMIEAVGEQFFGEYFESCSQLLTPNGKMVLQAITIPDQRYRAATNTVDFIKKYIFPGGCLPSVGKIAYHVGKDTDMQITHLRDIAHDYATTLSIWRGRFLSKSEEVLHQGFDEKFIRMWEFYLAYCEGGFRERVIGAVQLCLVKPSFKPNEHSNTKYLDP